MKSAVFQGITFSSHDIYIEIVFSLCAFALQKLFFDQYQKTVISSIKKNRVPQLGWFYTCYRNIDFFFLRDAEIRYCWPQIPNRKAAPDTRTICRCAKSLQSCLTLSDPIDHSPPGSSVHGTLQQEHWSGLPCPPPGGLPNPGIQPRSLRSPALAGGFFTTRPPGMTSVLKQNHFPHNS